MTADCAFLPGESLADDWFYALDGQVRPMLGEPHVERIRRRVFCAKVGFAGLDGVPVRDAELYARNSHPVRRRARPAGVSAGSRVAVPSRAVFDLPTCKVFLTGTTI